MKKKIDLMMKHPLVDVLIVMLVISLIGMGSYAFFNISSLSRGTFEQTAFSKRNPPTYRFIAIVEQGDLAYAEKIKQGMDEAASSLGVAYEFWGIEGTDKEEKLLRQLDIALLSGVDGILVQSRNTEGFSELLKKAIELGVPVVTLGEDVVSAEKVSHFGINTYAMGSRLVEVLETEVGLDSYGGDLLILQGNPMVMKDFASAIKGNLKSMREVIAVPVIQEEDNQLNLEASLRQILVAYPDTSTIVCSSTRETLGVVSALIDMNRIHDTLVVGLDTNEEIEAHLRTGVVDVAIYVDYFKVGNQAMTHLFKYLQGEFVSMYSTVDVSFATQWSMNEPSEEVGENHEK